MMGCVCVARGVSEIGIGREVNGRGEMDMRGWNWSVHRAGRWVREVAAAAAAW
jgi:hypothetical protein